MLVLLFVTLVSVIALLLAIEHSLEKKPEVPLTCLHATHDNGWSMRAHAGHEVEQTNNRHKDDESVAVAASVMNTVDTII